jgi:diadenosine tetraphosphate (Ap4A) HIT family hydrolase
MPWSETWDDLYSGAACPMCAEGRPEETPLGIRIFAGEFSDAYLAKRGPQRGYAVVTWRGRHAVEPVDLEPSEAAGYWAEVLRVAAAVRDHFQPRKLNYDTLGNWVPHLHTHITARYETGDVRPGMPLPKDQDVDLPPEELRRDAAALQRLLQ